MEGRMRRVAALLAAPLLVLAACDAGERENAGVAPTLPEDPGILEVESQTVPPGVGTDEVEEPDDADGDDGPGADPARDRVAPDALLGTQPGVGGPYGELRDGTWGVGPAGEVEFAVTGPGSLVLSGVRPADGWVVTEQDASQDEFDVDLSRGPVTFEVQVEMDEGVLDIQIAQDIDPAQPGTFFVGEAATVTVAVQGQSLLLGAVLVDDGWVETDRDVDDDDIELHFQRAGDGAFEVWTFTAELDDGALEVHIDYEISGAYAG